MKKIVAIVPMKLNNQRLPQKNTQATLLLYSFDAVKNRKN